MVVLDTSIWIALLNTEDSRHKRAVSLYDNLKDDILIPEYVFLEVCSVLAAKNRKQIADAFTSMTESNEYIELLPSSPQFFKDVRMEFLKQTSSKFSFTDISLVVLSRSLHVYTFDAALYKILRKTVND